MNGIKCVLLDIEGTICPISFVKDTLFPYALKALPDVLDAKWNEDEFLVYREAFPNDVRGSPEDFKNHVEDLTRRDVKVAYLKNLQGYLWETGYKTGAYSTPLFPDVVPQLKRWKSDGVQLAIYSSGSVFAQKLLFGHVASKSPSSTEKRKLSDELDDDAPPTKKREVNPPGQAAISVGSQPAPSVDESVAASVPAIHDSTDGKIPHDDHDSTVEDLQYMIADWFDTTNAGLKQETSSYKKIADALKLSPTDVLFLSDNVKEVDAAIGGGMKSIVVDRPGNAPLLEADKDRLRVVDSLYEISLVQEATNGDLDPQLSKTRSQRRSQRLRSKKTTSRNIVS